MSDEKIILDLNNMNLEESVVALLKEKHYTVTTAESCTAGLVAATIMNVSGASEVYSEGYITYSDHAKAKLLGVSENTLETYTAYSAEVAYEMAEGAAKAAETDAAISVTGIAGPSGGTKEKPVGLVYIGVYVQGKVTVKECHFHGNREEVRAAAVVEALTLLREELK